MTLLQRAFGALFALIFGIGVSAMGCSKEVDCDAACKGLALCDGGRTAPDTDCLNFCHSDAELAEQNGCEAEYREYWNCYEAAENDCVDCPEVGLPFMNCALPPPHG